MTELDVLEELIDDDEFIRTYPSFRRYLDEWDELEGAHHASEEIVFEFYAEKIFVNDAVRLWRAYQ